MKIQKILYDDGEKGIQLSIAQTRAITDQLEESRKFETFIVSIRNKYQIPVDGYDYDKFTKFPVEDVLKDKEGEFFDECLDFTRVMQLPHYWYSSFAYFALYNVFFTPEEQSVEYDFEKSALGYGVHIILKERMSKNQLIKLIDKDWDKLEQFMMLLPEQLKGHKFQKSEIAKLVYSLKKNRKYTFSKITNLLQQKYKNESFIDSINEDNIKMLYHRWIKLLKKNGIS